MGSAFVTGVFGVLVVLVTALVSSPSRAGRIRKGLQADLDLLKSIQPGVRNREELQEQVEADLHEYVLKRRAAAELRNFVHQRVAAEGKNGMRAFFFFWVGFGLLLAGSTYSVVLRHLPHHWLTHDLSVTDAVLVIGFSYSGFVTMLVAMGYWMAGSVPKEQEGAGAKIPAEADGDEEITASPD